ncbi:NADPH-dependent FMN reductase [Pseudoalteromonas luteoviolacea]|uniref:NADPH-dependent FMN reductase n=1 Tax=Pseudoalteromonas luteoviolacea TaxID=43657 RepID=UPI001B38C906|nr:NAD(P)H-dependent oxidoreductase [Pseudoalteromonas luteoviolacea]MBQ4836674.1 NAD(P)H-dependent oxidoreductase [Pseudoalteromonas luteoviolacea]
MNILAFGASNSKKSINQKLAFYAATQVNGATISLIDLNDYEMPIYSEDREKEFGIPELATRFYNKIAEADLIVVSFAEYNSSYTAAYKNLLDWTSRVGMQIFQQKQVLMLATSPGAGGAKKVLSSAQSSASSFSANLIGAISLPSFYDNFDLETNTVTSDSFNTQLIDSFKSNDIEPVNLSKSQQ